MILRKVQNLGPGAQIRKPLPDKDVPELCVISAVRQGERFGLISVEFHLTDEKVDTVYLHPDDLVEIVI